MAIKMVTFNMGRSKQAADLLNVKLEAEGIDVALLQEPYHRYRTPEGFRMYRYDEKAKALIVCSDRVNGKIWMDKERTCSNRATVVWEEYKRGVNLRLTCVYDEPEQQGVESRFSRMRGDLGDWTGSEIIGGDFNAKNMAWGGDICSPRGVDLLEWAVMESYTVENRPTDPPTFSSNRGNSWVDLLITKSICISDREIEDEDTLSDHRYITFRIACGKTSRKSRNKFQPGCADWAAFRDVMETYKYGGGDVNEEVGRLQEVCRQACERAVKRRGAAKRRGNEWWNERLQRERVKVRKLRKLWQVERQESDRERRKEVYMRARSQYGKSIKKAKEENMNERLERFGRDPWGEANRWLKKGTADIGRCNIRRDDGSYTTSMEETANLMVSKHFPKETREGEGEELEEVRRRVKDWERDASNWAEEDMQITKRELENVVSSMKPRKAPGQDGIPNEALKHIVAAAGTELIKVFNECREKGKFPAAWKKAELVWLPKKDGGVRPISLLPAVGKLLDKIIARRIVQHMESTGGLDDRQYGFREGRATVDAAERLIGDIREIRSGGNHALVVTLDLRNAFNSAWTPRVVDGLLKKGVNGEIVRMVKDFLSERKIAMEGQEWEMQRGCPQGSSLGPVLWLAIMEGWFEGMRASGVNVRAQAFADDQVVVIEGSSVKEIERTWRDVWDRCMRWAKGNKLEYNGAKTEAMFIPARGSIRPPVVTLGDGERVVLKDYITYLGITVDVKLLWVEHAKAIQKKTSEKACKMFALGRREWGDKWAVMKALYERAICPMLLYGAEVWGDRASDSRVRKRLRAAERPFMRALTRAYGTASNPALSVIAGCIPLEHRAEAAYQTRRNLGARLREGRVNPGERVHPAVDGLMPRVRENEANVRVFVDASRDDRGRMAYGLVKMEDGVISRRSGRIVGASDVNKAEAVAIMQGVEWGAESGKSGVLVLSDSQQSVNKLQRGRTDCKIILQIQRKLVRLLTQERTVSVAWTRGGTSQGIRAAEMAARGSLSDEEAIEVPGANVRKEYLAARRQRELQLWQQGWDGETIGRWTHRLIQTVDTDGYRTDYKLTQVLTGHGNFQGYFRRFNITETDGYCDCDIGGTEDIQHVVMTCSKPERVVARAKLKEIARGGGFPPQLGPLRKCEWEAVREWASMIVNKDD